MIVEHERSAAPLARTRQQLRVANRVAAICAAQQEFHDGYFIGNVHFFNRENAWFPVKEPIELCIFATVGSLSHSRKGTAAFVSGRLIIPQSTFS